MALLSVAFNIHAQEENESIVDVEIVGDPIAQGGTGTAKMLLYLNEESQPSVTVRGLQTTITFPKGLTVTSVKGPSGFNVTYNIIDSDYEGLKDVKIVAFSENTGGFTVTAERLPAIEVQLSASTEYKGGVVEHFNTTLVGENNEDIKDQPLTSLLSLKITGFGMEFENWKNPDQVVAGTTSPYEVKLYPEGGEWYEDYGIDIPKDCRDILNWGEAVLDAKAPGTATIEVTTQSKDTFEQKITVIAPLTGITLNKTALSGIPGYSETLTVTYDPTNTTSDKGITWSSSDEDVATVSTKGKVTLVAPGTAVITATSKADPEITATCTVTVNEVPATEILVDPSSAQMKPGETLTLRVNVHPLNSTDIVEWSSPNDAVATVSDKGVVTAVAPGKVTIIAKAGTMTAPCTVTVIAPATGITLDKTTAQMIPGETLTLTATVTPSNSTDNVTWNSLDESVATVSDKGVVTAVAPGTVEIFAMAGDCAVKCTVTVNAVPVTSVTLSDTDINIEKGKTATLTAIVAPDNATDKTVTWSSSDDAIATVENGVVTAVTPGTATITAKAGEITATCKVTVVILTEGVTLDKNSLVFTFGDEPKQLTATLSPENTTDEVTWSSSDEAVATVSDKGVVTAVAPGTAVITAKAGTKAATCTVTVKAKLVLEPSTDSGDETPVITPGESIQLVIKVEPADAEAPEVTWSSSDESIAKVDENGKVTPGDKSGTVTITATTPDGETLTFKVTVNATRGISLDKTTLDLKATETYTLVATLDPSTSGDDVTWSSSDEAVATVSETGEVTAVAPGTAVITASCGEFSAQCTVNVTQNDVPFVGITSLTLSAEEVELALNYTYSLFAIVTPEDATNSDIEWSTSDPNVARVYEGVVTGVTPGEAVITATTKDGSNLSASCKFTIVASSGIDGVSEDDTVGDLYNINGVIVMKGVARDEVKNLAPGYYIFRFGNKVEKILVR